MSCATNGRQCCTRISVGWYWLGGKLLRRWRWWSRGTSLSRLTRRSILLRLIEQSFPPHVLLFLWLILRSRLMLL